MAEIPLEAVMAAVIALITAAAMYLNAKRNGLATQNVALVKDSEFQKRAIRDLALFSAKVMAANVDGKVSQDEYDDIINSGKELVFTYGEQFGVGEQVHALLNGLKPT